MRKRNTSRENIFDRVAFFSKMKDPQIVETILEVLKTKGEPMKAGNIISDVFSRRGGDKDGNYLFDKPKLIY